MRKECEERFELTEKLSEAKEELLQLKKPSGEFSAKGFHFLHLDVPVQVALYL